MAIASNGFVFHLTDSHLIRVWWMADLSLFTIEKDCPSSIQPCLNWEKWQLKSNASV